MADYQLTDNAMTIIRTRDGAYISISANAEA